MKVFLFISSLMTALTLNAQTSSTAVICGEAVDTTQIQVSDNYLGGQEVRNKAFLSAALFEGTHLRTTICSVGPNRYLIIKAAHQAALDPRGAIVKAYPFLE